MGIHNDMYIFEFRYDRSPYRYRIPLSTLTTKPNVRVHLNNVHDTLAGKSECLSRNVTFVSPRIYIYIGNVIIY